MCARARLALRAQPPTTTINITRKIHTINEKQQKISSVHINRSITSRCKHPGIMSIQIKINLDSRIFLGKPRRCRCRHRLRLRGPLSDFHCALSVIWKIAIINFNSLLNRILSVRPSLYHRITEYIVRRTISLRRCGFPPPPSPPANNAHTIQWVRISQWKIDTFLSTATPNRRHHLRQLGPSWMCQLKRAHEIKPNRCGWQPWRAGRQK